MLNLRSSLAGNFALSSFEQIFQGWMDSVDWSADCGKAEPDGPSLVKLLYQAYEDDKQAASFWWAKPLELNGQELRGKSNPLCRLSLKDRLKVKTNLQSHLKAQSVEGQGDDLRSHLEPTESMQSQAGQN